MKKHISIHKSNDHHVYQMNHEETDNLIDRILDTDKFVYPNEDVDTFYLYDVDENVILEKEKDYNKLTIPSSATSLNFIGLNPNSFVNFKSPSNVTSLTFEGGTLLKQYLSKTLEGLDLWHTFSNCINLYKISDSFEDRLIYEAEIRGIYKNEFPKHAIDFGLNLSEFSCISSLRLGYVYLSKKDYEVLSNLNTLTSLEIYYAYNNEINALPINLKYLKVFGTLAQNLSEFKIDCSKLSKLDLEGNTLSCIDSFNDLPKKIKSISFKNNLVADFIIDEIPDQLEYLIFSDNLIKNTIFEQGGLKSNLKYLDLSNNKLVITSSLLHIILEIFPTLEVLILYGNKTNGVPKEYLGDAKDSNCLTDIKYFLEGIEFLHNSEALIFKNFNTTNHYVNVAWPQDSFPNVLVSDIQFYCAKHFNKMPSFKQFMNGLYCNIEHDETEIFMFYDSDLKQFIFRVQSTKEDYPEVYFHKYLHELNSLVAENSHLNILPLVNTSKSCNYLKEFCKKVFKIHKTIKKKNILRQTASGLELLVNNISIDSENKKGKFAGDEYIDIDKVAFVFISGKNAYPFIIADNVVTNQYKTHKKYYYTLTLRDSSEKENLHSSLTNIYLNNMVFSKGDVFIDNNVTKKGRCYVNPKYFKLYNGGLQCILPGILKLENEKFNEVNIGTNKYCEFTTENNIVKLQYVK